eukprot:scaffold1346_cov51-Cyclotella_meneghiniana.AAC.2
MSGECRVVQMVMIWAEIELCDSLSLRINPGLLVATVEKRKRSHANKKEGPGEGPRDAKRSKDEVYYR